MLRNFQNSEHIQPGSSQGSFEFNESPDQAFIDERNKIADQYGVANLSQLTKKGDRWFMGVLPVEEWASLYSGNDNSDQYHH